MKMTRDIFIETLIEEAKKNSIIIDREKAIKLYEYKELLIEWNQKINLTAITDDKEIILKHFIDSLLVVKYINKGDKIIDVGTGAGFPGIVLAIYFGKAVNITLIDSLQKRVDFLNNVITSLKLDNTRAIHGRAEEIAHKEEYREKYDIAIARAVAPLNILLEYLAPYIKKDGICICMKSVSAQEEIKAAEKAIETLNLIIKEIEEKILQIENDKITRIIISLKKEKNNSNMYPRQFAKIRKKPL